jgi:hypothetical protein
MSRGHKYITKVLDLIKSVAYNHIKVGNPDNSQSNKIVVFGQYTRKLEKVNTSRVVVHFFVVELDTESH